MATFTPLQWAILTVSFGMAVLGLVVGVQAYRGYRRNDSRPMQYLSVGLILLTAVPFTVSFGGTLVLFLVPDLQGVRPQLQLVAQTLQFGGLAFITYSLYKKP